MQRITLSCKGDYQKQ